MSSVNQLLYLNLTRFDNQLRKSGKFVNLYVTGGAAMAFYADQHNIENIRETKDVDFINFIDDPDIRKLQQTYSIEFAGMFTDSIPPEDFVEASSVFHFSEQLTNVTVFIPPLEFIFVNKAMSTRQKDLEDCLFLANHVNLSDCKERIDELLTYQAYLNPDLNLFVLREKRIL